MEPISTGLRPSAPGLDLSGEFVTNYRERREFNPFLCRDVFLVSHHRSLLFFALSRLHDSLAFSAGNEPAGPDHPGWRFYVLANYVFWGSGADRDSILHFWSRRSTHPGRNCFSLLEATAGTQRKVKTDDGKREKRPGIEQD